MSVYLSGASALLAYVTLRANCSSEDCSGPCPLLGSRLCLSTCAGICMSPSAQKTNVDVSSDGNELDLFSQILKG